MTVPSDPVSHVMRRSTVHVRPASTLREIAETLVREEVGAAVVKGAEMAGIVSERDLVRALADGVDPDSDRAEDVMTFDVVSVRSDTTIESVARTMLDGGIRHLPIIDEDGPVGIVSIRDLFRAYLDQ
ncbi:MAG TPA: CBS domain-containing protein [Acidimicrobiales bacterium]|nr:CBS domain-containing protein [Acidimicrobiales bacterium]